MECEELYLITQSDKTMENLDKLFETIQKHDKTIIFGNLGRLPHVLSDYLIKRFPTFEIVVVSYYYKFPTTQHIKSVSLGEEISKKCDLLIYAEPKANKYFTNKPIHAARMAIFTSHWDFIHDSDFEITNHFYPTVDKIKELQALKEADEESRYIEHTKNRIDFVPVLSIGRIESDINISPGVPAQHLMTTSYLVINLTNIRSAVTMYLLVWDAFDYMLENINKVEKWMICFPETGAKDYLNFVNLCIDRIFCKNFDNLPGLLSKIPFYKSGVVDRKLDSVEKDKFFNMEYVSPKSREEAFKACILYDLDHIGGNIFHIK